jgi:cytochrome P450
VLSIGTSTFNRNPDFFGPTAAQFDPDRWLSPLPDKLHAASTSPYASIMSFSSGPRQCIGYRLAVAELNVVARAALTWLKCHRRAYST